MLGTATPQPRVLLVHQPGPWGPRGLLESRCDPDVARRIDVAAASAGMRLQAIRRHGKHEVGRPAGGYLVGVADSREDQRSISWWRTDDLAQIAADFEAGWPQRPPVAIDTAPLYLVCTHGRHDACCALRGRPLAHALQHVRPGRVWETTHLGGDRFAANLLVLPTGELYGRVSPTVVPELVERVDEGEVVPGLMRGRIGLTPIAQAALVYAHEQLAIAARAALSVTSVHRVNADLAHATVSTPRARAYHGVGITEARGDQ
jgi:hypothetical protein